MYIFTRYILSFCFLVGVSPSRVLELGEKFPELRKEGGYWLINFYAPWCGHCKMLEPIWNSVAQALSRTNIMVGRIDCRRFPSVAAEFGVRGYPTIKFVSADSDHTFTGDRVKENIVKFAVRMAGPPVQLIQHSKDLNSIKSTNNLFFMYVGEQEEPLWNIYHDSALELKPHVNFYSMNEKTAIQTTLDIPQIPSIFVYKDDQMYFYTENLKNEKELTNLNSSVLKWMNEERFETFPKVSRGNINELIQTNKYLVLVIVEETKLEQIPELEFLSMVENFVTKNRSRYNKEFQFGWVGSPELANSIALQVLPLPHLLVLNSRNHHHYLPENNCSEMTPEMLDTFLERITNQSVPALGGDGFWIGIHRMYFDTTTSLVEMWIVNPILTTVLFGLPLGIFSFIIHSICCDEIMENDEDGKDDESDSHEKID